MTAAPPAAATGVGVIRGTVRDGGGNAVKEGLVRVLDPTPSEVPPQPLVLEEKGGRLTPPVAGLVAGQGLLLRAGDKAAHVWSAARGGKVLFRLTEVAGVQAAPQALGAGEGPVEVRCEEHPGAVAHVVVQPNAQASSLDGAGHFEVRGVRAGFHTLEAWRPGAPPLRQTVEVAAGGELELDVVLPRAARGAAQ